MMSSSNRKKMNVQRIGFSMPTKDIELLEQVKMRCLKMGIDISKSELIRAGIHALNKMKNSDVEKIMTSLSETKIGKPKD